MYSFFFQAEGSMRGFCLSRGLGDVYKEQSLDLNDELFVDASAAALSICGIAGCGNLIPASSAA